MNKYKVTIDTEKTFKVMEFDNYNTACKMAIKYKEFAFSRKKHWIISFYTNNNLDARITT